LGAKDKKNNEIKAPSKIIAIAARFAFIFASNLKAMNNCKILLLRFQNAKLQRKIFLISVQSY
jgi:hypothetical protein